MTQKLIIGVDLDNTLVAWEDAYLRDALAFDQDFPSDEFRQRSTYDLDTATSSAFTRLMVMRRPNFYSEMDPIPGALEALVAMVAAGREVQLISQPDIDNPTCHSDKNAWVARHFGPEWCSRLVLTHDKTLWRGDVLIDDKPHVTGLKRPTWDHVYYTQRYNQHLPGPRIDNWLDLDALWQLGLIEAQEEVAA